MYPLHFKDIALGVLSIYIAVDILLSFSSNTKHTSVFSDVFNHISDRDMGMVLIMGAITGLFVYYFARKSRENFTEIKMDTTS